MQTPSDTAVTVPQVQSTELHRSDSQLLIRYRTKVFHRRVSWTGVLVSVHPRCDQTSTKYAVTVGTHRI